MLKETFFDYQFSVFNNIMYLCAIFFRTMVVRVDTYFKK